jgi:hypothetical protein
MICEEKIPLLCKKDFFANFYNIKNFVKKTIKIRLIFLFSAPGKPPKEFALEHSTQWEIGWLKSKKVILPDFIFSFLIQQ